MEPIEEMYPEHKFNKLNTYAPKTLNNSLFKEDDNVRYFKTEKSNLKTKESDNLLTYLLT